MFDTEMLTFNISGGTLAAGAMLRESPTLTSTGQTTMTATNGGYAISSFFDVFLELSLDAGANWVPATASSRIQLVGPPVGVPGLPIPTLSEWGLIILALLMLVVGTSAIRGRKQLPREL
jgi:hypothetical protein